MANQDLGEIKQGATVTLKFTFTDADTGAALDMTGYTMLLVGRDEKSQATNDIQKDDADWDKTDQATGVLRAPLVEDDTKDLPPGKYHFEAKGVKGSSVVKSEDDITLIILKSMTT